MDFCILLLSLRANPKRDQLKQTATNYKALASKQMQG